MLSVAELARFLEAHRHGNDAGAALVLTASDGEQHGLLPSLVNALPIILAILAGGDDIVTAILMLRSFPT